MVKTICAVLLGVALTASAAPPPRDVAKYTRVLLPFLNAVFTNDGVWSVTWWFRNDSDVAADAFPLATAGCEAPLPPDGRVRYLANPAIRPHAFASCLCGDTLPSFAIPASLPIYGLLGDPPGAFVYVESASRVSARGSVRWQQAAFFGGRTAVAAQLDGISEAAFFTGSASISAIPHDSGIRYALRLYALPETITSSPRVTITVYEMQPLGDTNDEQIVERLETAFHPPAGRIAPCAFACDLPNVAYTPAAVELFDIFVLVPQRTPSTLRVEIAPASPDVRWWGVVSATDAQQNVTLYTPPFRMTSR